MVEAEAEEMPFDPPSVVCKEPRGLRRANLLLPKTAANDNKQMHNAKKKRETTNHQELTCAAPPRVIRPPVQFHGGLKKTGRDRQPARSMQRQLQFFMPVLVLRSD